MILSIPDIDTNIRNISGEMPLHRAILQNDLKLLQALLKKPLINLNERIIIDIDKFKEQRSNPYLQDTPLLCASRTNHLEALELLLSHPDTNPWLVDKQGKHATLLLKTPETTNELFNRVQERLSKFKSGDRQKY